MIKNNMSSKIISKYNSPFSSNEQVVQRDLDLGDSAWKSIKNVGSSLHESAFTLADSTSSIVKLSASGYTSLVAEGADYFGYDQKAKYLRGVTKNLQSSSAEDWSDAKNHFEKSGKYGNNAVSNLVHNKSIYTDIDKTDDIEKGYKTKYNPKEFMRFKDEASYVYKPNEFYEKYLNDEYTNKQKNVNLPLLNDELEKGEKTVLSKVDSSSGLETYMKQELNSKNELFYKLVFRGTWPKKFNEALQKHDESFDFKDIVEDGLYRGKRQANKAKSLYQDFFKTSSNIIAKYKFKEIAFIGHSLGGFLANSVMVDFVSNRSLYGEVQPKNIYAETYNALGLTNKELKQYEEAKKNSKNTKILSVNHRTEYDPVSHIGVQPDMMVTHNIKDQKKESLYNNIANAHSMDNFTKSLSSKYLNNLTITKDKATMFDKYVVDNDFIRMPVSGTLLGIVIGGKSAYNFGAEKVSQVSNFVSNTASSVRDGVVSGGKKAYNFGAEKVSQVSNFVSSTASSVRDGVVSGGKKAYNFGAEKVLQVSNFVSNTASSVRDGVVSGGKKAYNFGAEKVSQVSNFVSSTASSVRDGGGSGSKKAYDFADKKSKQFGNMVNNGISAVSNTVSEGWNNVTDLFKFAEANRHVQKPMVQSRVSTDQNNIRSNRLDSMESQLDKLSIEIFRQMTNGLMLEYARSSNS